MDAGFQLAKDAIIAEKNSDWSAAFKAYMGAIEIFLGLIPTFEDKNTKLLLKTKCDEFLKKATAAQHKANSTKDQLAALLPVPPVRGDVTIEVNDASLESRLSELRASGPLPEDDIQGRLDRMRGVTAEEKADREKLLIERKRWLLGLGEKPRSQELQVDSLMSSALDAARLEPKTVESSEEDEFVSTCSSQNIVDKYMNQYQHDKKEPMNSIDDLNNMGESPSISNNNIDIKAVNDEANNNIDIKAVNDEANSNIDIKAVNDEANSLLSHAKEILPRKEVGKSDISNNKDIEKDDTSVHDIIGRCASPRESQSADVSMKEVQDLIATAKFAIEIPRAPKTKIDENSDDTVEDHVYEDVISAIGDVGGDVDPKAVRRAMEIANDMARLEMKYPESNSNKSVKKKKKDNNEEIPVDELFPSTSESEQDDAW